MLEFIKVMQELNVNRPYIKDNKIIAFDEEFNNLDYDGNISFTCKNYKIYTNGETLFTSFIIPEYEYSCYTETMNIINITKCNKQKLKIYKDGSISTKDFNDIGVYHIDDLTEENLFYLKLSDKI